MKVVYIDCGAHVGRILNVFRSKHPEAEFYAFECNPHFTNKNYGNNVNIIHSAVWTFDGTIPLYVNDQQIISESNSIFPDKTTGELNKEKPIIVDCLDFNKWLLYKFDLSCCIHIKMNIEGAEYPVLEHCISGKSINLINFLYIQWHWEKIPSIGKARHDNLVQALQKINTLKVYEGYGRV